jgi:hypothetical protein
MSNVEAARVLHLTQKGTKIMKLGLNLNIATLTSLFLAAGMAWAADSGSIDQLSGTVTVTGADKISRKVGHKEKIQSGDLISTEAKSEVVIKLADESVVALRPNTQFRVEDFKYEKKATDTAQFSLLRGIARLVTGLVGKSSNDRVRLTAATATVGIRGTDFEVAVVTEDTADARAGVYDRVYDGATNIKLASGPSMDVKKEQTAFAPDKLKPGEEPLYILDSTPVFLQSGGGFDALMQSITMQPINAIQQMPMFR